MTTLSEWREGQQAKSKDDVLAEARKLRAEAKQKLITDVNAELIEIKRLADAITEAQEG